MSKANETTQLVTMEHLKECAHVAEREVATLRAEHSDAILAGRGFDPARIRVAEDLVAATNDAIRELEHRQEDQARADEIRLAGVADQERLEQALKNIRDAAKDRETAIDRAESAARTFMAEYTRPYKSTFFIPAL